MTTYLLVYSSHYVRDQVRTFLDSRAEIHYWLTCLPNSFFVSSEESAGTLRQLFQEALGRRGQFVFVSTRGDRDGWLPEEAWDFMAKPKVYVESQPRLGRQPEQKMPPGP